MVKLGGEIVGTSKDMAQDGAVTFNTNYDAATNGLAVFKFEIVAVKTIVNVSAILFIVEYQFTNIVIELNMMKVVLPPNDPVTDIV